MSTWRIGVSAGALAEVVAPILPSSWAVADSAGFLGGAKRGGNALGRRGTADCKRDANSSEDRLNGDLLLRQHVQLRGQRQVLGAL